MSARTRTVKVPLGAAAAEPPPQAEPAAASKPDKPELSPAALAYLHELDEQAGRFMHEAESLVTFMEYSDENHSKQWTAALGIMLPVARRFFDYARLFDDLGSDLRKSLVN